MKQPWWISPYANLGTRPGLALPPRPSARIAGASIRGLEPGDRTRCGRCSIACRPTASTGGSCRRRRRSMSRCATCSTLTTYTVTPSSPALHGEIIGLGECHAFRRSPTDVEVAVTVDDEFHRRGLGPSSSTL